MPSNIRYSQHARRAMMEARQCAFNCRHSVVDTSHLLLGILQADGSIGQQALHELDLLAAQVQPVIETLHTRHDPDAAVFKMTLSDLQTTRALRATLTYAVAESQAFEHEYIGTEHLLLGLARGGGGVAPQILGENAISMDRLRRQVCRMMQAGETEIGLERALRTARLSELSRRVLIRASLLAEEASAPSVNLAHLTLALVQERRSPAGRLLTRCGLNLEHLTAEAAWPRSTGAGPHILEDLLDEAVLYAERLGSHYTGTDHLVAVLVQNRHGSRLLAEYGVSLHQLSHAIDALLRE